MVVAMLALALGGCRSRHRSGSVSGALGGNMYGGSTYGDVDAGFADAGLPGDARPTCDAAPEGGGGPSGDAGPSGEAGPPGDAGPSGDGGPGDGDFAWQPVNVLPANLMFEPAGDEGLWFDPVGGVVYGSRASFHAMNAQLASMLALSPGSPVDPIRRAVYAEWQIEDLAVMLANAEAQAGANGRCVASCYLFAERLKAFPWTQPVFTTRGGGVDSRSTVAEASVKRTGTYPGAPGIDGRTEGMYDVKHAAAFGIQLELVCEYSRPCAGQTLQCGVDVDQTISGGMESHAKVEQNLNPWGFGNRPGAKAEQSVIAGFFRKGEGQPVELNLTQQAEARIPCGYEEVFTSLVSDCGVINQEGLNWKCKGPDAVFKIGKLVYQCAKTEGREKKEATTISGGYKEDRFLAELGFNPNHTPKLATLLGQTHLTYGREAWVRDTSDSSLTHFARAAGSASIAIKAWDFSVKGGSAPAAVCQGIIPNGGFLALTLEAKPTAVPTPLPTEIASCRNIGRELNDDPNGSAGCMSKGECIRMADGHVFIMQDDGRAVLYDTAQQPPKAKYWSPGSSWPGLKFSRVCLAEQVAFINGGPGTRTQTLAVGIKEGTTTDITLDERPFDGRGLDLTCGQRPKLSIENGQLVLQRNNGRTCKTYTVVQ